jgi:hypothetical protein
MAQTGYTPIQLYYSSTAAAQPTAGNLNNGELALNIADKKLYAKDSLGNVFLLASSSGATATVQSVSVVSANGLAGTVATATTTPAITLSTTVTGLLKGNGTAISAAVSGTDYAPATSGSAILYGNGSGGFSNVTIGSGVSFVGGVLSASGTGVSTFSAGTTGFTPSSATSGAVTLAGTLATTNGGTGLTSFTANGVVYASSTSALATGSALTFDGTNLGIGTSSPNYKLNVLSGAGSQNIFQAGQSGVSNGYTIVSNGTNLTHQWYNGGSEAMRLDTSGNLGLGVTPSAWSTVVPALQLGTGGTFLAGWGSTSYLALGANASFNGSSWIYKTSNASSYYDQSVGSHRWYNAPSGTAGNAITFTQAMTLDASGNLLVGATASSGNSNLRVSSSTTRSYALIDTTATTGAEAGLRLKASRDWYTISDYDSGALKWYDATSAAERMRLDSSGNFMVGVTSTVVKMDVAGAVRGASTTITGAAGGTINPTSNTTNQYTITALGAAATIDTPTGTPIDGQKLTIRIKDNGTGRALTWTTSAGGYRVIGTTLPTTTTASKVTYVGCVYNSQDSFWDVVAVTTQA